MGTIPDHFVVGFNQREGTYSERIGFVSHYMTKKKDKVRYNDNFHKWRDKSIELLEMNNEPTDGFVIHDRSGGNRCWSKREKKMRVWDPRGWEFELGMDGIEHIITHSDIIGGQIQGDFVYGWFGLEGLTLISTKSNEYKTLSQSKEKIDTLKPNALEIGGKYLTSTGKECYYLGKYHTFFYRDIINFKGELKPKKTHLYLEIETFINGNFINHARTSYKIVKQLEGTLSDEEIKNIVYGFNKSSQKFIPESLDTKKFIPESIISEQADNNVYLKNSFYQQEMYNGEVRDIILETDYSKYIPYEHVFGFYEEGNFYQIKTVINDFKNITNVLHYNSLYTLYPFEIFKVDIEHLKIIDGPIDSSNFNFTEKPKYYKFDFKW